MQGLGLEFLREPQQACRLDGRYERVCGNLEAHILGAALHGVCGGAYQLGGERLASWRGWLTSAMKCALKSPFHWGPMFTMRRLR